MVIYYEVHDYAYVACIRRWFLVLGLPLNPELLPPWPQLWHRQPQGNEEPRMNHQWMMGIAQMLVYDLKALCWVPV